MSRTCMMDIPGCACDQIPDHLCDLLDLKRGTVNEFCECHDCYHCGAIDCDCTSNAVVRDYAGRRA